MDGAFAPKENAKQFLAVAAARIAMTAAAICVLFAAAAARAQETRAGGAFEPQGVESASVERARGSAAIGAAVPFESDDFDVALPAQNAPVGKPDASADSSIAVEPTPPINVAPTPSTQTPSTQTPSRLSTPLERKAEEIVKEARDGLESESGVFGAESASTAIKALLAAAVLTLAPALLLMTTSYVRISVALAFLRQGLGAGQVPSNQTLAALSIFLTFLIMAPTWTAAYQEGIKPYSEHEITREEAIERAGAPLRTFLCRQIERAGNGEMIGVFMKYAPDVETPQYYEDVPWRALLPSFLLSELKVAFLIGFQILLPFLIIDLVVSSVLVASGMMMTPPAIVSLPFKLALFVMVDGWTLTVKSLLESFA